MTGAFWTPEQEQQLADYWHKGLSAGQIGIRLGVTRNSVIGKVHRLNLPARAPRTAERKPRSEGARAFRRKFNFARSERTTPVVQTRRANGQQVKPGDPSPVLAALPSLDIAFENLKLGQCRYPYGDGPFSFCGHPVLRWDSSYCAAHHARCWRRA